jgi:hypothetical protein
MVDGEGNMEIQIERNDKSGRPILLTVDIYYSL